LKITKQEAVDLYVNCGKTTAEIAQIAGCTPRYIRQVLRDFGVDLAKSKRRPGMYRINNDFFKHWSPEMSYVLGFVLTDGTIFGNSFSISQKDPTILERINEAMWSNFPIKRRKNNGDSYIYVLTISRKCMVDDLHKLGITANKSRTVDLPPVPDQYWPHFIRGVIDGDGWVHKKGYTVRITSGSRKFSYKLRNVLKRFGYNCRVEKQSGVYRIVISGKNDIKRLADWLYADAGVLFLPRKRERMEGGNRHATEITARSIGGTIDAGPAKGRVFVA